MAKSADQLERKRLLDIFLNTPRDDRPELTLDEINEEIRLAREERKKRELFVASVPYKTNVPS